MPMDLQLPLRLQAPPRLVIAVVPFACPLREGSDARDSFARTGIRRRFRLEKRQRSLSTIGSPASE
jgi:hypothetical protein